jgi:hypothetical protein
MTRLCQMPGCTRVVMTSSSGAVYAYCRDCTRIVLGAAFAPENRAPEWVRRMREGRGVVKVWTR